MTGKKRNYNAYNPITQKYEPVGDKHTLLEETKIPLNLDDYHTALGTIPAIIPRDLEPGFPGFIKDINALIDDFLDSQAAMIVASGFPALPSENIDGHLAFIVSPNLYERIKKLQDKQAKEVASCMKT